LSLGPKCSPPYYLELLDNGIGISYTDYQDVR
jgi:hypothetical protein